MQQASKTDTAHPLIVCLRHMAPLTHPQVVNPVFLDFVLPVKMPDPFKAA
ncbi:MAG: hypothetical protein WBM45_02705 [Woeseiaceae bacterium]|jgi:hypothetical protein